MREIKDLRAQEQADSQPRCKMHFVRAGKRIGQLGSRLIKAAAAPPGSPQPEPLLPFLEVLTFGCCWEGHGNSSLLTRSAEDRATNFRPRATTPGVSE